MCGIPAALQRGKLRTLEHLQQCSSATAATVGTTAKSTMRNSKKTSVTAGTTTTTEGSCSNPNNYVITMDRCPEEIAMLPLWTHPE
jgi:hypothetical protein